MLQGSPSPDWVAEAPPGSAVLVGTVELGCEDEDAPPHPDASALTAANERKTESKRISNDSGNEG
jgi:hypothetical protein